MSEWKKLKNRMQPFYSGFPVIVLFTVLAFIAVKKYLKYATPMYESVAAIKLADANEGIPHANLYKDFDVFASSNKISAEVQLLQSNVLLSKAVRPLNLQVQITRLGQLHNTELYNESPFLIAADITNPKGFSGYSLTVEKDSMLKITSESGDNISGIWNHTIPLKYGSILVKRNDSLLLKKPWIPINDNYTFKIFSEDDLVANIKSRLDVMSVDKDVPVLRIAYRSEVPAKAADVVNAIANAYISDYIDEKVLAADTTVNFLKHELSTYSNELAGSEQAIEAYRNQKNIINIRQETETDLRKIAELKKQLASVQMNLHAVDSLNSYVKNGQNNFLELAPNFEAFNDLLSTEIIKKIKNLQADKKDLLLKYTPENDKVLGVDAKINDLNAYIGESIENTRKNLQIKYDDLNNTITESEKVFVGLPNKEKTMTVLDRNFTLDEQIYRFLHQKKTDAEIARAASISFHRIISTGEVPQSPVSPNAGFLKLLAIVFGMLSGIALVYLMPKIKGRITSEKTIQKSSDTPLLVSIPYLGDKKATTTFFKRTGVEMEIKNREAGSAVITVSSYNNGEGKDFTAHGLANALALLQKKVLLVNGGEAHNRACTTPADFCIKSFTGNKSEWLSMMKEWQNGFDIIIIKNVSLADDPQGLFLMTAASLNLFILDSRKTKKTKIEEADIMKQELDIPNMHYVLNRAEYHPTLFTYFTILFKRLTTKKVAFAN